MTKFYTKDENGKKVVYEKGVFGDKKIGETKEKFDGSLELDENFFEGLVRNTVEVGASFFGSESKLKGPHVKIEKEKVFGTGERRGEVDGAYGTFIRPDEFTGESEFVADEEENDLEDLVSNSNSSWSERFHKDRPSTPYEKFKDIVGTLVPLGVMGIFAGWIVYAVYIEPHQRREDKAITRQELAQGGISIKDLENRLMTFPKVILEKRWKDKFGCIREDYTDRVRNRDTKRVCFSNGKPYYWEDTRVTSDGVLLSKKTVSLENKKKTTYLEYLGFDGIYYYKSESIDLTGDKLGLSPRDWNGLGNHDPSGTDFYLKDSNGNLILREEE